jgi:PmbA protein
MTGEQLLDLVRHVGRRAREHGADEVSATVSRSEHTGLQRRDGRVEQATESITRGLGFSVLVGDRFSSHSTSDLRPEALEAFISRAVAATRFLEEDADRRLPPGDLCGRGCSAATLDQLDQTYAARTADDRAAAAEALELQVRERQPGAAISEAVNVSDGTSVTARAMSNGFVDIHEEAWFMTGAEMTVQDGPRRPEASAYYATRYLADLPPAAMIADKVLERVNERIGSAPIASGSYPMVLANRAAGRILGVLGGPIAGGALHQGRSCMAGKLGQRIGSKAFTVIDDPCLPRGLASRPWDGDGLVATRRAIVDQGTLQMYYLGVYYARKLAMDITTGGRSNWIIPPGTRSWSEIASAWPKAIWVDGFLGGNSNPVTGDFSFGIRGMLLEYGKKTRSLSEMNVTGNVMDIFERLVEVADDPFTYSSTISPTLVFEGVQFSGM